MEDYIFIIIAIVLSVFGAINKKKKQDAARSGSDDAHSEHSFLDDLFGEHEFEPERSRPSVVPPPVQRPAPRKKEKLNAPERMEAPARLTYTPLKRESLKHSYLGLERKPRELQLVVLDPDDKHPAKKKHPMLEGFSMEKAVIYSEILQRRY